MGNFFRKYISKIEPIQFIPPILCTHYQYGVLVCCVLQIPFQKLQYPILFCQILECQHFLHWEVWMTDVHDLFPKRKDNLLEWKSNKTKLRNSYYMSHGREVAIFPFHQRMCYSIVNCQQFWSPEYISLFNCIKLSSKL